MKKFLLAALAVSTLALSSPAFAERGDWGWIDDPDAPESMYLTRSDGSRLDLSGTERYCVWPGDSYAYVRSVLVRNGLEGRKISWKVANWCNDGYARICVTNRYQERACSTYEVLD